MNAAPATVVFNIVRRLYLPAFFEAPRSFLVSFIAFPPFGALYFRVLGLLDQKAAGRAWWHGAPDAEPRDKRVCSVGLKLRNL